MAKITAIKVLLILLLTSVLWTTLCSLYWLKLARNAEREPTLSVSVLVTPNSSAYWDRFLAMDEGWLNHFRGFKGYSFSSVAFTNDSRLVQMDFLFPGEDLVLQKNIHLAAFQHMSDTSADWYLQVDDDTIIVPANLKKLVRLLDPTVPLMLGKCAHYQDPTEGGISFAVGGGGILVSKALMQALSPHLSLCRKRYNPVAYADARVGACVSHTLHAPHAVCPNGGNTVAGGREWSFTNRNVRVEAAEHSPGALVVSLHEKAPSRIRMLNSYVQNLTQQGVDVTWRTLLAAMDDDGY